MATLGALADLLRIAQGPMRRLFIGQFCNALGTGLTLALLVVYLSDVRGIPVPVATGLLAWQAVLSLVASPVAGSLVDRFGPRHVLMVAALLAGTGVLALAHVTSAPQALVAMTLTALGMAGIWGPSQALAARLVAPVDRPTAFGFGFMLLNLGIGFGGLIAATIIDLSDPATFTLLYTLTASTFLALFLALLSMGDVGRRPVQDSGQPEPAAPALVDSGEAPGAPSRGSWREVLTDRTLLRFAAAALLLITFGYGCIEAGVALFMTASLGLPEHYIGVVFAANTAVIVVAQMFVLAWLRGRSRSYALAAAGVLWASCWLLFAVALGLSTEGLMVGAVALGMIVFALGETLWSPTSPALINELAPEHLRGRYNSTISILWGVGGALGPLLTGTILADPGRGGLWAASLSAGCLLGALLSLRLRQHLTATQDGRNAEVGSPG